MRIKPQHLNPHDEQGVTLVIVVISLVALFGMVVLTVDVGGLLLKRRAMVNAADAASIAAAQGCADSVRFGAAEDAADATAADNASAVQTTGTNIDASRTVNCTGDGLSGHVTVRYDAPQDLWFAPVLGFDDSSAVAGEATTSWGAAGSGDAVPFVLTTTDLVNIRCDDPAGDPYPIDPESTPLHTKCHVWLDNGNSASDFGGFSNGVFGTLNLNAWDVSPDASCSSKDLSDNRHYAQVGGYDGDNVLYLNWENATWVCVGSGDVDTMYDSGGLAAQIGNVLAFPVAGNSPGDGQGMVYPSTGKIDKFNIIGFVALKLVDILEGKKVEGASYTCSGPYGFAPGSTLDLDSGFSGLAGCPGTVDTANDISPPAITGCLDKKGGLGGCAEGKDYTYDGTTHVITWTSAAAPTASVTFDWSVAGPCGPQPSNASAHCLVVSWEGGQYGNGEVGGGYFGITNFDLCDLTVGGGTGSCADTKLTN